MPRPALIATRNNKINRIETNRGDVAVLPDSVVILALGTVESTRLALVSFPNSNGLIGKNLMGHLRSKNTTIHFPRSALGGGLPDHLQAFGTLPEGANGQWTLSPADACGVRGDVSNLQKPNCSKRFPDIDQAALMATALQSVPDDHIVITLRGFGEIKQNPLAAHSRIELDPEVDENAINRAKITIRLTQKDLDLQDDMDAAAVAAAREFRPAGSSGLRFLNGNQWVIDPFTPRDGFGTTHHEAVPYGWALIQICQ